MLRTKTRKKRLVQVRRDDVIACLLDCLLAAMPPPRVGVSRQLAPTIPVAGFSDSNKKWLRRRGQNDDEDDDEDEDDEELPVEQAARELEDEQAEEEYVIRTGCNHVLPALSGCLCLVVSIAALTWRYRRRLGEEELQTNIQATQRFVLPSGQEVEAIGKDSEDLTVVQMRIKDNLNVLRNFAVSWVAASGVSLGWL